MGRGLHKVSRTRSGDRTAVGRTRPGTLNVGREDTRRTTATGVVGGGGVVGVVGVVGRDGRVGVVGFDGGRGGVNLPGGSFDTPPPVLGGLRGLRGFAGSPRWFVTTARPPRCPPVALPAIS